MAWQRCDGGEARRRRRGVPSVAVGKNIRSEGLRHLLRHDEWVSSQFRRASLRSFRGIRYAEADTKAKEGRRSTATFKITPSYRILRGYAVLCALLM
ncbi:hypothetical protein BS78_09G200700 [Paspalum vaginatum]|nr:hypothetical protein BS78_09G200700 [Paspalum vaginatum]